MVYLNVLELNLEVSVGFNLIPLYWVALKLFCEIWAILYFIKLKTHCYLEYLLVVGTNQQ
jgi:hypothetical protein